MAMLLLAGCKDNIVETSETSYNLLYQRPGLLDSITGDCSVVVTRTLPLDSIDFRGASKMKMEFNAYTDADISFMKFYYINADTAVNVIDLEGSEMINRMSVEADVPSTKQYWYLRLGLRSSVCTGDIFHIKLRDLKISTK